MKKQNPGNPAPWVDLIAFLGVLTVGGILVGVTGMTAASLATVCGALAGLYAAFERFRIPRDPPQNDDSGPESGSGSPHSHDS